MFTLDKLTSPALEHLNYLVYFICSFKSELTHLLDVRFPVQLESMSI